MTTSAVRLRSPVGTKWLMALLAPALIVCVVLMHSLLLAPDAGSHTGMVAAAPMDHAGQTADAATAGVAGHDDPSGHGTEGGMSDCSGLMAMCLALLVSLVALIGWPRAMSRWIVWRRPPPTLVRLGVVREAFQDMTARQRTTVIRC